VDRRAIGAVEAKPEGMPLSGVEAQSAKYWRAAKKPARPGQRPVGRR
jgi:type I restriction enzyme, R subunit